MPEPVATPECYSLLCLCPFVLYRQLSNRDSPFKSTIPTTCWAFNTITESSVNLALCFGLSDLRLTPDRCKLFQTDVSISTMIVYHKYAVIWTASFVLRVHFFSTLYRVETKHWIHGWLHIGNTTHVSGMWKSVLWICSVSLCRTLTKQCPLQRLTC